MLMPIITICRHSLSRMLCFNLACASLRQLVDLSTENLDLNFKVMPTAPAEKFYGMRSISAGQSNSRYTQFQDRSEYKLYRRI